METPKERDYRRQMRKLQQQIDELRRIVSRLQEQISTHTHP